MAEPILQDDNKRWTIEPIVYPDLWKLYKLHESMIWHAAEVKLHKDLPDWQSLDKDEQRFIKMVLAFFASSDVIVGDNLVERFMKEVKVIEVRSFYACQLFMENIHSEVYSNMIVTYITDVAERYTLLNAIRDIPCIKKKTNWARKWINDDSPFAVRLLAFAIVEGILFSGSFCAIYWLNERGIMPGLADGNNFIARDEGLHTDFACYLYRKYISNKLTQAQFKEIMTEAVNVEVEFITEALPCRLIGMNAELMIEYIKYVANRLTDQVGHEKLYDVNKCPFDFMERIALKNKSNFFESDPTEYQKAVSASNDDTYADL